MAEKLKRSSKTREVNTMRRNMLISIALAATGALAGCSTVPSNTNAWLSYPYSLSCGSYNNCSAIIDQTEATNYYKSLGITPGAYYLSTWLQANGFPGGSNYPHTDAHAIYANLADLRIGR